VWGDRMKKILLPSSTNEGDLARTKTSAEGLAGETEVPHCRFEKTEVSLRKSKGGNMERFLLKKVETLREE